MDKEADKEDGRRRRRAAADQKAREALRAAGIPESVTEYAIAQNPSGVIYAIGTWSYVAVMIAGFAIGGFALIGLEPIFEAPARASAEAADAVLFYFSGGWSALIAIFGWIFASGWIVYSYFASSPRLRASLFVLSFLDPKNAPYARMMTPLKKLEHLSDPEDYVTAVVRRWANLAFWPAAVLFALALVALDREVRTYTLYSRDGFVATPFFPWSQDVRRDWKDAAHAQTGCNHVTGKSASDSLVYLVTFADGREESLAGATPIDGTWLDGIEKLDAALVAAGVEFRRWKFRERDPLHPACLAANRRKFGADWPRVERLLRIEARSAIGAA